MSNFTEGQLVYLPATDKVPEAWGAVRRTPRPAGDGTYAVEIDEAHRPADADGVRFVPEGAMVAQYTYPAHVRTVAHGILRNSEAGELSKRTRASMEEAGRTMITALGYDGADVVTAAANKAELAGMLVTMATDIMTVTGPEDDLDSRRREQVRFRTKVTEYIKAARKALDKFADDLRESPFYYLDNCDRAFEKAATLLVYGEVSELLEKRGCSAQVLGEIYRYIDRKVMQQAQFGTHRSTSQTSNIAEAAKMSVQARLLEDLRWAGVGRGEG